MYDAEYESMLGILNKDREDEVIDVMRSVGGGVSPITYGDIIIDENGQIHPMER